MRNELAFLDRPELPLPEQLLHAVEAVLAPIHLRMLREELPEIVAAAKADRQRGTGDRDASAAPIPTTVIRLGALLFVGAVLLALRKSPRLAVTWVVVASLVWLVRSWLPHVVRDLWAKLMG